MTSIRLISGGLCLLLGVLLSIRLLSGNIGWFPPLHQGISGKEQQEIVQDLKQTILILSETNGSRNAYGSTNQLHLQRTAEWIFKAFAARGYSPTNWEFLVDSNRYSLCKNLNPTGVNIVAEKKGSDDAAGIILLGAHYDTMPFSTEWEGTKRSKFDPERAGTPGANDNASGVAALLHIAHKIASVSPKRTVRFVAFANEEPPFFQQTNAMGSWRYAQECKWRGEQIEVMISLDALAVYNPTNTHSSKRAGIKGFGAWAWGLPDETSYVAFMSNWDAASGREAIQWARIFSKHSSMGVRTSSLPFIKGEYFAWSDDWSFTRHGYAAFTVTDTAFYRSARYHEMQDNAANLGDLDFEGLAAVANALADTVKEMANR